MSEAETPSRPRLGRGGEIALAIIGGIFGLLGGIFALGVGGLQQTGGGAPDTINVSGLGLAAIGFSSLAILASFFVISKTRLAGWLLVVAAIGGLISISFFYILPFILLFIAGLMCLFRKNSVA